MENILKIVESHPEYIEKRLFDAGETLFLENDTCKSLGVVKSGVISIKSYFSNGKEVVYNVLEKGQMFGNNLIFSSNPAYRGDVVAEKPSEIYFITKENLFKLLRNDEKMLEEYLTEQSDFSKTLNLKIKLLTIQAAKDRVIYYLTFNKGFIRYKTITKLANELFLTRESLSRTLKKLVDEKTIKIGRKVITLMV